MGIKKKALKPYIYISILSIVAVISCSIFAFLEKGLIRDVLVIVAIFIFIGGIAQFLLYRYFFQTYSRSLPKEAREEYFQEIPPQL